jgi:hypothetical protein
LKMRCQDHDPAPISRSNLRVTVELGFYFLSNTSANLP